MTFSPRSSTMRFRSTIFAMLILATAGLGLTEQPHNGSGQITSGAVITQTKDSVTLNIEPCGKERRHTVSPYKIISSREVTCPNGRKTYTKITVEETGPSPSDGPDSGATSPSGPKPNPPKPSTPKDSDPASADTEKK